MRESLADQAANNHEKHAYMYIRSNRAQALRGLQPCARRRTKGSSLKGGWSCPWRLKPRVPAMASSRRRNTPPTAVQTIQSVASINAVTSVNGIMTALRDLDPSPNYSLAWSRKLAMDELYRDAKTETPYGKVCQDLLADGKVGQVCIYTCNPFALLYHACSKSEMFFQFLKGIVNNTADGYLDIAVYLDKATPGNNRRPDDGRSMQCLYWTVVEFPGWFISRRNGWIPFGYVLVKDQKEMQLTDTMLVRFLMRRFGVSSDQLSFQGGFGLEGEAGGTDVLIFRVKAFLSIADGEQHNKTFNLKGHFATVPCRICKNCMGRCAYFTDPYLVHVHSEEYEKLDYMSPEELNGLADELKVLAETGRPSALAKREQEVGLKYDPTALLWDLEVRAMLRPPLSFYPDFMHVFFASGGLAQYELNGMILFLEVRYAIEATDVDTWIANVKTPSGMSKISKKFSL